MAKDTLGGRLLQLMGECGETDKELAFILEEKYGIKKSDELIKKWRNNERLPNADIVLALSDHYGVSADYLLGRDVPRILNTDINMICAYTGLSQNSVEVLHYCTLPAQEKIFPNVEVKPRRTVDFINRVLDRESIPHEDDELGRMVFETVFSRMEDYVCSTGAWFEDEQTGEKRQMIPVNFGGSMPMLLRVDEFLSGRLMESIRRSLETLRKEYDAAEETATKKRRKRKHEEGSNNHG
jgi:transcriptional regulator with XRE-family HTH domain